jgi:meso-butanediol dehydrogenase / (S,S)-butanediol dehydrogenase / diacetyl reductase
MPTTNVSGLLAGRLTLVTGAASGIGQAISVAFAAAGAAVIVTDLSAQACAATAAQIAALGGRGHVMALDVTDAQAVQALATRVGAEHGDLHVLVNNAGIILREPIDADDAPEHARRMMDVNYFGALNTIRAWLPALRRTRGTVINVASGAALHGQRGAAAYSASKGALKLLTQSLAGDFGRDGVRVNALAPGVIETPMTELTRNDPHRLDGFLARIPARRLGQPHEIAAPAVFLASDMASYVNGIVLSVDGGLTAC